MKVNLCWFGLHVMGKWSKAVDSYDSFSKAQFRRCLVCNAIESRGFNHKQNITAATINEVTP